jgi:excisionase family DNA binding protein
MYKSVPGESANWRALSVNQACALSGIGRTNFYKLLKNGKITAHKCGGRTIILSDELHQALKALPRAGRAS